MNRAVQIATAALRCGLTPRAVRLYEEIGLVVAARDGTGRRLYDSANLERLHFVAQARRVGLGLDEIRALLQSGDRHGPEVRAEAFARACARRLEELEAQRDIVRRLLSDLSPRPPATARQV